MASLTGESITDATRRAPEERLQAVRRRTPQRDLRGIIRRGRARPMLDARHADEILGYGGDRLPA